MMSEVCSIGDIGDHRRKSAHLFCIERHEYYHYLNGTVTFLITVTEISHY